MNDAVSSRFNSMLPWSLIEDVSYWHIVEIDNLFRDAFYLLLLGQLKRYHFPQQVMVQLLRCTVQCLGKLFCQNMLPLAFTCSPFFSCGKTICSHVLKRTTLWWWLCGGTVPWWRGWERENSLFLKIIVAYYKNKKGGHLQIIEM